MLDRFPRLRPLLDRPAGLLSGDEQQMLALAHGLLARPALLLLDEPSLGLAPAVAQELFEALSRPRDEGLTLLLVDQMTSLALPLADRCAVLAGGRADRPGGSGRGDGRGVGLLGNRGGLMDWIVQGAWLADGSGPVGVGVAAGRIAAVAPRLQADAQAIPANGCLLLPGLVETHVHLNKTCILDRCPASEGSVAELAQPLRDMKDGRMSFTRQRPALHPPQA